MSFKPLQRFGVDQVNRPVMQASTLPEPVPGSLEMVLRLPWCTSTISRIEESTRADQAVMRKGVSISLG